MNDRLRTTKETADFLRCSERALERWRSTGDGPRFVRIGPRRVAYREADLAAWLDGRAHAHRAAEMAASTARAA